MILARVSENEKRVYVDVNGYITKKDAKEFLNKYKEMSRSIKFSKYELVVTPGVFQCEDNRDIRSTCMTFLKSGYKKIYLVDDENALMNSLALKPMEKKLFLKSVNVIPDKTLIR